MAINRIDEIDQNFISVDEQTAINSYGEQFKVGQIVAHQDTEAGEAKIKSFECKKEENEITVHTSKGHAHLDFIISI